MILQFYPYLVQSLNIILVIMFAVFIYKGINRKFFAPFLTTALILALIGNIIAFIENDMKVNLYGIFLISIGFFFLYLHFEALISIRPKAFTYIILLGLNSMLFIITLIKSFDLLSDDLSFLICSKIMSLGAVIAFSRILIIAIKVNQNAKLKETKLEFIAMLLFLIYAILYFIRNFFIQDVMLYSLFSQVSIIFSTLGSIFMVLNYILHPNYIYYLPFPIHSVILYNKNGVISYSRNLDSVGLLQKFPEIVLSGTFSAISILIKETLGSGAKIQKINADQYQIYFINFPKENMTLAVIALGNTYFFQKSLKKFSKLIPHETLKSMNEPGVNLLDIRPEIDKYLLKAFPYIRIKKI